MSDETWTETHRERLEHLASTAELFTAKQNAEAIRAALAEIARLTAELEVARLQLEVKKLVQPSKPETH